MHMYAHILTYFIILPPFVQPSAPSICVFWDFTLDGKCHAHCISPCITMCFNCEFVCSSTHVLHSYISGGYGGFSTEGCVTNDQTEIVTCSCNHLTTFTILSVSSISIQHLCCLIRAVYSITFNCTHRTTLLPLHQ